jgi:single-strand DNA-binding protein
VAQTLTKGNRVIVTGRLKAPSAYQAANGEARASLELEIDEIGPSLRYATAAITRRAREAGSADANPWGDSAPKAAANDGWANPATSVNSDDTPF